MSTSFSDLLSQSITENSGMSTPPNGAGKRKVSLSVRNSSKKRKNLIVFRPNENDEEQETKSPLVTNLRDSQEDAQEFGATLNSLHEINSRAFNPTKAFNYNFINHLNSFVKNKSNFKTFGVVLDAGTKIYSSKVDILYDGAQKISSSLAMATDEQNMSLNDDDGLDGENRALNARKKRHKPKKNVDTVVSNPETINSKLDTNIPIDPLFHHLSAAFDVGNVSSLLMANLSVDPSGTLLLDSDVHLNFDSYPKEPSKSISFPFLRPEYAFENQYVCKHFKDFEFMRRDLTVDIEEIQARNTETELNFDFDIDTNTDVDVIHNSGEFDLDDFPADFSDEQEQNSNKNNDQDELIEKNLLQFLPENDDKNEFFSRNFLKSTFKNNARYGCMVADNKKKPAQKKVRPPYEYNNYNVPNDVLENKYIYDDNTLFCNQTVSRWAAWENRLEDAHLEARGANLMLKKCFIKDLLFDKLIPTIGKNNNKNSKKFINGNCDDNCGEDFFSNDHDDDYDGDVNVRHGSDMLSDNFEDGRSPFDLELNTDDQQPSHVDALDIDYAKVAKKIDIKKVKLGMWDFIQKSSHTEQIDYSDEPMSSESGQCSSQKMVKFSSLRQNLPTLLSSNLNENLSTPISFVALLHLCNEKNLKLEKEPDYGDFVIQPET